MYGWELPAVVCYQSSHAYLMCLEAIPGRFSAFLHWGRVYTLTKPLPKEATIAHLMQA